jgi:hypothetical protein
VISVKQERSEGNRPRTGLPQLVRQADDAGLRVLTWRDTTPRILEYFQKIKLSMQESAPGAQGPTGVGTVDGYIETLSTLGGRTGILIARRTNSEPRRRTSRRRRD